MASQARRAAPRLRDLALLTLSISLVLLGGCRFVRPKEEAQTIPPDELRILMRGFNEDFSTKIERLSDVAVASTSDPAKQRTAIIWKMRLIPLCKSFLEHPDAQVTFVDTWALCAQVQQLIEDSTHAGEEGFDDVQGVGAEVADTLLTRIERIGQTFLTSQEIEETRVPIFAFAESHQIGERFFAYHRTHKGENLGSFMGGLVTRPLNALNPFSGVSDTAVAIHEISETADSFRDTVADMPDILRWQVELTLHDIRHSPEVTGALENIDQVADGTTRVVDLAESLPEELRRTLHEAEGTIDTLKPMLDSANACLESFDSAGATWSQTFVALQTMVASFTPEVDPDAPPKPEPAEPPRPFDILDYAETAERLTATAAELRGLIEDVKTTAGGTELKSVAGTASDTARSTVDHIVLRVGQLIAFLLVGLVVVRIVWTRTGTRPVAPGPMPTGHTTGGVVGFKRTQ